ncbi:unnamed protein product [Sphenostylis stenocarpa]|uniref:Serine/threonine-protein kinase ATM n=1 Tax=Sphenostylis stenocarpa TaxID=92480 RepID=A0AA86VQ15_9FABA|nr:unnamed protein product [Sphenostylis stenocarpa]
MPKKQAAMDVDFTLPGEDAKSDEETKITENTIMHEEARGKLGRSGFDSRERRKSKYLSYPYTNLRSKQKLLPAETENLKTPCLPRKAGASSDATKSLNISSSYAKLDSKRFRKNWYRKFISCNNLSSSPKFMNASTVDFLAGLSSTAVDCMFPVGNEKFDLVEQFFCRYRISKYHDEAELATSQVNAQEDLWKPVGNDLPDTKSKRKNNKVENAVRRKRKSRSGLSDSSANMCSIHSQMPGKKLKQNLMEKAKPGCQVQNIDTNLIGERSKCSSIPQTKPNLSCLASEGKGLHRKRKMIEAQEHQSAQITSVYTDAKKLKCSSLIIDLQFTSPSIPGDIAERNKEELVFISPNPEPGVSQEGSAGRITDNNLLVRTKAEADTVLVNKESLKNSLGKEAGVHLNTKLAVEQTGRNNTMEKAAEKTLHTKLALGEIGPKNSAEMAAEKPLNTRYVVDIPDLNGTGAEGNSISTEFDTVNFTSVELKPEQPKSLSACSRPIKTTIYRRLNDNGESLGNCLLLRFAPVACIPSKEDLMSTFCRFGPLKPSQTQLLKDTGSAQVVFVRSKDAAAAFRSLEQDKFAFGSTLIDCKLHHPSAPCPPVEQLVIHAQPMGFMTMLGVTPTQPAGLAMPGLTPAQPTGSVAMPGVPTAQPTGSKGMPGVTPSQPPGSKGMPGVIPTQPILSMPMTGMNPTQPTVSMAVPGGIPTLSTGSMAAPGVTVTPQTRSTVPMPSETAPSLQFIKKNLQIMTSILENAGGSLSPQMRAKLDSEIKNLMRKVNSRTKA